MAVVSKGAFTLNLGIVRLGAELSDEDRQCAWELHTEVTTRVAVIGKIGDRAATDFSGELLIESFDSLHTFFQAARHLMRRFPVGRIPDHDQEHLGIAIHNVMVSVLRPFLEKWQVLFRSWWESTRDKALSPFDAQNAFPQLNEMLADWTSVRLLMRQFQRALVETYALVDVASPKGQA